VVAAAVDHCGIRVRLYDHVVTNAADQCEVVLVGADPRSADPDREVFSKRVLRCPRSAFDAVRPGEDAIPATDDAVVTYRVGDLRVHRR
jgi:hypothetical protein